MPISGGPGSSGAQTYPTAADLASHAADTTSIHGITDTSALVTTTIGNAAYVRQDRMPKNAKDYSATGNGSTDDTAAIQAALTAAGVGGSVFLPAGDYKCTSTLTVPQHCTVFGSSFEPGVAVGNAVTQLNFDALSGSTTAVVMGSNASLRSLAIVGPGAAVGTVKGITGATCYLDRVDVSAFATGTHITNGYFCRWQDVDWSRNATALQLTGCYNFTLITPRILAGYGTDDATLGVGITGAARGLNIVGGAIESYGTAIALTATSHLSLVGVYFETAVDANAWTVRADSLADVSVYASGCFVYLNGARSFVTMESSTEASLVAHGNHFVCTSGSSTTPPVYYIDTGQHVHLTGDNYTEVVKVGATYVTTATGTVPGPGQFIQWPEGSGTAAGTTYDGRRTIRKHAAQTLAANGAVTIDAADGDTHNVTLNANATSSSISNGVSNQELTIRWIQDGTGGRTYSWPSNAVFVGGSAPSTTTLNTHTLVRFRYNGSAGRWTELYRSVAVPNS